MYGEDLRPPNEKSHAYHFSISYNGCEFYLLTPPAILALPKCLFKGCLFKFVVSFALDPGLVIVIGIVRYCTKMSTKDAKHKKQLTYFA